MTSWKAALEVARWEFLRWVKPKQQVIGFVLTFALFLGGLLIGRAARGGEDRIHNVAVVGGEALPLGNTPGGTVRFSDHAAAEIEQLRAQVRDRELDGLLVVHDTDRAELFVRRSAAWTAEIQMRLAASRQQLMTSRSGLAPETIAAILAPPQLAITQEAGGSRAERITMIIIISVMLMTVFIGMSYIFTSITGEKQIRVTEQVVSAIPAQAWIDGKIIGLIAVSIVGLLTQLLAFAAVWLVFTRVSGGAGLPWPAALGSPLTVGAILLFGLLGLFFWFAFLGAIAAMIDDPQSSTRSSFLMLPVFMTALAFVVLPDGTSTVAKVLSLLPLTSPSAMPARILTGDAGAGAVLLSLALLAIGTWTLRIAAGRIFRLGMLMYGKEPSWSEVRRWMLARH